MMFIFDCNSVESSLKTCKTVAFALALASWYLKQILPSYMIKEKNAKYLKIFRKTMANDSMVIIKSTPC